MDEDDFEALGFTADAPADDGLGFVEDLPEEGSPTLPDGYAGVGRRELVLPETTFTADPRGRRQTRVTVAPGGPTEYREVDRRMRMRSPTGREGDVLARDEGRAREAGFVGADDPPPPTPPDERSMLERLRALVTGEDPQAFGDTPTANTALRWAPALAGGLALGAARAAESSGIGAPTVQSASRAVGTLRRGGGLSDALSALLPSPETEAPIIGRDLRSQGMWSGIGEGLLLGHADEIGAALGGLGGDDGSTYQSRRDDARRVSGQAQQQAPGAALAGRLAGSAPYVALPTSAPTAAGRVGIAVGTGLGLGTARGFGESEAEDAETLFQDAAVQGGLEGALAGVASGAGELAAPALRRLAGMASRGAGNARQAAVQSRLEGTGVWGGRAMRAADEMPGGQARLAEDLRRLGVGGGRAQRGGPAQASRFPRPERALDDAADLLDDAGQRMRAVLDQMDEAAAAAPAGAPGAGRAAPGYVDVSRAADALEEVASRYERIPVGGPQVARALRERIIDPLRASPVMTFGQAHQQRRLLDDYVRTWRMDPDLTTASGQLQTARRAISQAMDDAAEALDPAVRDAWRSANRDYSVGAFVGEYGRGAERLSVQGGIGGAAGTAIENAGLGNVMPVLGAPMQREAAQAVRMRWPGIRAAGLEGLSPRLDAMGAAGQRWARLLDGAQARGPQALRVAHASLMRTDPAYRRTIEDLEQEAAESGEE
jgi:hypothetical protein